MTTAATKAKIDPAARTAAQARKALATAKDPATMNADAILAELQALDGPLTEWEALVDESRERRLALWCAARLLPPDGSRGKRPIFMALAEASNRSEALVIKQTKRAFTDRGITPPR